MKKKANYLLCMLMMISMMVGMSTTVWADDIVSASDTKPVSYISYSYNEYTGELNSAKNEVNKYHVIESYHYDGPFYDWTGLAETRHDLVYVANRDGYDTAAYDINYVVQGEVNINQRICFGWNRHNINLILCDGAALNAEKGIEVDGDITLNIYGQEKGTGQLNITATDPDHAGLGGDRAADSGNINIHGGIINVAGGAGGAGIGSGNGGGPNTVTIYGGTVTATGGEVGAGIGGGHSSCNGGAKIYGGTVTATGGEGAEGIGIGTNASASDSGPLTVSDNLTVYGGDSQKAIELLDVVAKGDNDYTRYPYMYVIERVPIVDISLDKNSATIETDGILQLTAKTVSAGGVPTDSSVVWDTSNSDITLYEDEEGTKPVQKGPAHVLTVYAHANHTEGYCTVSVKSHSDPEQAQTCAITIDRKNPVIEELPTVDHPITYGTPLTIELLTGGKADTEGSFSWDYEIYGMCPKVKNAADHGYLVTFFPKNNQMYHVVDAGIVRVEVLPGTWKYSAPTAKTDLVYQEGTPQELLENYCCAKDRVSGKLLHGVDVRYGFGTKTKAPSEFPDTKPMKTEAGTYYIWFHIAANENHNEYVSEKPVEVTIAKPVNTVTFDVNGLGEVPAVQMVNYKDAAKEPDELKVSGYTFGGWHTDAACKSAHEFSTPITKDITLYAKWIKNPIADGETFVLSAGKVKVTSAGKKTVALTQAKNKKTVTVPAYVTIDGQKYRVTSIAPKAFKGTKVKKVVIKTKKLTKKSVKNSLKGSKVKTIKVKVGKKKANKKYVKKYKKIFTKKNAGKKVTVK